MPGHAGRETAQLDLSSRSLTAVPAALFDLQKLVDLNLARNNLTTLPRCLRLFDHALDALHGLVGVAAPGSMVSFASTHLTCSTLPLLCLCP